MVQETLIALARQIAQERSYPRLVQGLQPLEDWKDDNENLQSGLKSKFVHELTVELRECVVLEKERVWMLSEAADCLYYAACIDLLEPEQRAYQYALLTLTGPSYQINQEEAEASAVAKYSIRAALPYRKHKETSEERKQREDRENKAIMIAVACIEQWPGYPLPEVSSLYDVPVNTLYSVVRSGQITSRKSEKTLLIKLDQRWYAWYASYNPH